MTPGATTAEVIPSLNERSTRHRDGFIASLPESEREIAMQAYQDLLASDTAGGA
ncbi:MAG: hypothetical protein LJE91_16780 [Gammaproteobacteria bacterium]|jgi:hypothetical protein|nr:hypothetical protein [Gammaproteobacteria bacterium]